MMYFSRATLGLFFAVSIFAFGPVSQASNFHDELAVAGASDYDGDGISNSTDRCSGTPANANIWRAGEWIGCAGGQRLDTRDSDGDGVTDGFDYCSSTPAGSVVHHNNVWQGCAASQGRYSYYYPRYSSGHNTTYYRLHHPNWRGSGRSYYDCYYSAGRKIYACMW
jgi:hypothetical protein